MNKEDYIRDRERQSIDLQMAYEMYLAKHPEWPKVDRDQFIGLFTHWIRHSRPFVDGYFDYWDERFGIKEKGEDV